MFQNPYNKKEIGEFYANGIARAIAGIVEDKLYWGIVGNPDCGKGTMTQFLTYVFQSYIGIFNLNALKYNPRDGTDEARKLSWYVPLIGTRIIISNEARQDGKSLDGNLMKTLSSGGDTIVIRGCNQNELLVIPTSTSFSFVNDFPKVAPCDKAFKNRIMCVPHTKSFVNKMQEECNQYEMQADPQLKTKIMRPDWINAFFWIIMDAYNNGIKYEMPQEVAAEADELFIVEDVKLKEVMEERWAFVATEVTEKEGNMPNNFVSSRDILDYLQESGIRMSDATVGRELKKLGLIKTSIKVNKRTIRGWLGLSE
jgi:phage/plasmid-associated DNA primase